LGSSRLSANNPTRPHGYTAAHHERAAVLTRIAANHDRRDRTATIRGEAKRVFF
jgi:hypothetical protein